MLAKRTPGWMLLIALLAAFVLPAQATVTQTWLGSSSLGTPMSLEAELTISGDVLTVQLFNQSTVTTRAPVDLLSSYFFDIVSAGGSRPALSYVSAVGEVYLADRLRPDTLQAAKADLKAVDRGDNTWQFRALDVTANPFLGFGIGTVGNSNLSPNNFNGSITHNIDYSIYAGDVTTQNLDGLLLVKNTATFTFSGLTGFREADIKHTGAFGLGSDPHNLKRTSPEPATLLTLVLGGILLRCRTRSKLE